MTIKRKTIKENITNRLHRWDYDAETGSKLEPSLCSFIIDNSCLDGPINKVIGRIKEIEKIANKLGYKDIEFSIEPSYYEEYPSELNIYATRDETDAEFEARKRRSERAKKTAKKAAVKRKANKEQKEREEYEKVKKRYETLKKKYD